MRTPPQADTTSATTGAHRHRQTTGTTCAHHPHAHTATGRHHTCRHHQCHHRRTPPQADTTTGGHYYTTGGAPQRQRPQCEDHIDHLAGRYNSTTPRCIWSDWLLQHPSVQTAAAIPVQNSPMYTHIPTSLERHLACSDASVEALPLGRASGVRVTSSIRISRDVTACSGQAAGPAAAGAAPSAAAWGAVQDAPRPRETCPEVSCLASPDCGDAALAYVGHPCGRRAATRRLPGAARGRRGRPPTGRASACRGPEAATAIVPMPRVRSGRPSMAAPCARRGVPRAGRSSHPAAPAR